MAMCSSRELPETEYYWYMFQNPGRMNANSATIMDILLAHPDINVNEKDNVRL